jgi:hypothetical protein
VHDTCHRSCRQKMARDWLDLHRQQVQIQPVTSSELTEIHQALAAVQQTVGTLTFPRCDQDDVFELIDRVEAELHSAHPNVQVITTFLNSIARSLRAQPEAREACLVIEDAIEHAGIPSTWQTGI